MAGRWIRWGLLAVAAGLLSPGAARAQVAPSAGYVATELASSTASAPYVLESLIYNPHTDRFLTIDEDGFDSIIEIMRTGNTFTTIGGSFGLGGTWRGDLALATTLDMAYSVEGHARDVYTLGPAGAGAQQTSIGPLPGDPNGGNCPEFSAAAVDQNGDLICVFGPGFPSIPSCAPTPANAPADWFRVPPTYNAATSAPLSPIFSTTGHIMTWLSRDPSSASIFYAVDSFDPTAVPGYFDESNNKLCTVDVSNGTITTIKNYSGQALESIVVDRAHRFATTDVIWAIVSQGEIVPLDPTSGAIGATIASASAGFQIVGVAVAPSTANPATADSLFALATDYSSNPGASSHTAKLYEITKAPGPEAGPPATTGGPGASTPGAAAGGTGTTAAAGTGAGASAAPSSSHLSVGSGGGGGGCAMGVGAEGSLLPLLGCALILAARAASRRR
jgi:hypothetical protein